jgi:hypothetical protein
MNTRTLGRPIHSHIAERMVGVGNRVKQRYAQRESEERISGKVRALANGTMHDARAVAYEYEEAHRGEVSFQAKLAKPRKHWRDHQTGQVRTSAPPGRRWRNKEVTSRKLVRFAERASKVTTEVAKAAEEAAEVRAKAGADVKGRTAKRKKDETAKLNAAEVKRNSSTSAKTKKYNDQTRKEKAAASDPPRVRLGMINLLKPPLKEILALECEARGIVVSKGRTELVNFLVQALRDHHD